MKKLSTILIFSQAVDRLKPFLKIGSIARLLYRWSNPQFWYVRDC